MVLLIGSLSAKGVIPLALAIALVAGANLGTAVNPLIEGAGSNPARMLFPLGNLNAVCPGCAVTLPLLDQIVAVFRTRRCHTRTCQAVARLPHAGLNVALAVVFLPLTGPFAALLRRLQPAREEADDPGRPRYLDQAALEPPPLAIAAAAREALRMADWLEAMLREAAEMGPFSRPPSHLPGPPAR